MEIMLKNLRGNSRMKFRKKLKKMTDIMFLFVQNRRVRSWKFILRLNIDVRLEAVIKELKQAINLHPIGHWKGVRPEGKVFICILAYLLRKVMKIILNENGIYDSVSSVLDVLSEVKEVEISAENRSTKTYTAHC